uniref:Crinkler effector protein N-terminal domain-containing protein n=1 Tax=Globisporangium ultimum (strain ATCC 200006 / CBS 805.95 / DAOM BR144) TaxID=431595 RepID=K3WXH0_GLOUD
MMLFCAIVGEIDQVFGVEYEETDSVERFQEKTKAENVNILALCRARDLTLYWAKRDGKWLSYEEANRLLAALLPLKANNEIRATYLRQDLKMEPTALLGTVFRRFECPKRNEVHVFVELPTGLRMPTQEQRLAPMEAKMDAIYNKLVVDSSRERKSKHYGPSDMDSEFCPMMVVLTNLSDFWCFYWTSEDQIHSALVCQPQSVFELMRHTLQTGASASPLLLKGVIPFKNGLEIK